MANPPGQQPYTETDYLRFLDAMAPFLKMGATINAAVEDANLTEQKATIYNKYRLNDWFAIKIDSLRETPGKLVAYILTKRVMQVDEKIKQGLPVGEDEMRDVRFMAEKHRTAQTYFVTRTETAEADPDKVGKILDTMEMSDYKELGKNANDELGREAKKQMVAVDAPIQDKG